MNFELIAEQACESLIADLNDGHCVDVDFKWRYADDFWFAGYCLGTSFVPTPYTEYNSDYFSSPGDELWEMMEHFGGIQMPEWHQMLAMSNLENDLFIHSVDSRVGF